MQDLLVNHQRDLETQWLAFIVQKRRIRLLCTQGHDLVSCKISGEAILYKTGGMLGILHISQHPFQLRHHWPSVQAVPVLLNVSTVLSLGVSLEISAIHRSPLYHVENRFSNAQVPVRDRAHCRVC